VKGFITFLQESVHGSKKNESTDDLHSLQSVLHVYHLQSSLLKQLQEIHLDVTMLAWMQLSARWPAVTLTFRIGAGHQ